MTNPARTRKGRPWVLAAASGILLTLAYPPFALAPVAWVALVPLLIAVDGTSARRAFLLGWLTGAIGSLGVTGHWIFVAARDYFALGPLFAAAFTLGATQLFVGVYFGVFALVTRLAGAGPWRVVLVPASLVAVEYARAHLLSGCPWDLLGHSQTALPLLQVCDLTGVYGLSFLLALVSTALAGIGRRRWPLTIAALAVLGVVAYGRHRIATLPTAADGVRVRLVQGNLPNHERGRPERFDAHLTHYLGLGTDDATLVVWPENAIGFFLAENPSLLARITSRLRNDRSTLLAGAPRAGDRPGTAALYNSAILIDADGVVAAYDKRQLLPFVERLPFHPDDSPYLAGTEPTVFQVGGTPVGALICYEAIFPVPARELVTRGARLLVNISNDSWFEAGAGPAQHYAQTRFRAVENHVPLVRVTNSSISGVFDPAGRELLRLPTRTAVARSITVPLGPADSFYTHHGDVFAITCIALTIATLALRARG